MSKIFKNRHTIKKIVKLNENELNMEIMAKDSKYVNKIFLLALVGKV